MDTAAKGGNVDDGPFVNFSDDDEVEKVKAELTALIDAEKFAQALIKAREYRAITRRVFGVKTSKYILALDNEGWLEQQTGNYVEARRLFEEAIGMQHAVLKSDDPALTLAYNNLANLLMFQGDYQGAEPLLRKALSLQKAIRGEDDLEVAKTLTNLAYLLAQTGNLAGALKCHEESLAILKKDPTTKDSDLAATMNNMGVYYHQLGNQKLAKQYYENALEIRERALGAEHADVAQSLINLALIDSESGNVSGGLARLEKAVAIYKKTLGGAHPDVASALNQLGRLHYRDGNLPKAKECFLEAADIVNKLVTTLVPVLSFAEQRAFLEERIPEETSLLCSVFSGKDDMPRAYNYLFRWKGLLVEALRWQSNLRSLKDKPELAQSVARLNDVRRELADWFYKAGVTAPGDWQRKNDELIETKEQLERKLASAAGGDGVRDSLAALPLEQFRALMRPDECLIDIFKFQKQARQGKEGFSYGAVVSTANQPPQFVDLGGAVDMDAAIRNWRREVISRNGGTSEWNILRDKAWKPFNGIVPDSCTRVWLNSDSELARVPWHLFPSEDTNPMLVSQLDSNRELVKLREKIAAPDAGATKMLIAGGIDFGGAEFVRGDSVYLFNSLPGTLIEAEQIERLSKAQNFQAELLTALEPSKRRLLADIPKSDYVHLATHGYFLDDRKGGAKSRNPLLESGLLTAKPGADDPSGNQFLTAEELVGANFADAKLVTLSACETGLGEEATGQGVLGLRAAIMAAGSRCIVMSLWKVPDESTLLLMNRFYANLWDKKMPIAQALRAAQLSVRDEPYARFANPVHWAGWICVGDAW